MKEIPNSHLYQATTTTGGLIQVLVPYGANEAPYLRRAQDEDILDDDGWQMVCEVYSSTIRDLIES